MKFAENIKVDVRRLGRTELGVNILLFRNDGHGKQSERGLILRRPGQGDNGENRRN